MTVESKHGHSNVCYRSVFSAKCGTVYYALQGGSSSRPMHKIILWCKLVQPKKKGIDFLLFSLEQLHEYAAPATIAYL